MRLDLESYPYPSQRMPVMAPRGVVATSQPLATQAGLSILQAGGTAVEAALAAAIALTVVEPTSNGIGGDAFALVWDGDTLHGLNGSGRSPAAATAEALRGAGHEQIPHRGWWTVTVPGAPRTWFDLHQRFGRLPFERLFEPAVFYAERGYPVTPMTAYYWNRSRLIFATLAGEEFEPWHATFAPGGQAPKAGEIWRSPGHAETLRRIAASNATDFYDGELAEAIADFAGRTGGPLRASDLAAHRSDWVEPIAVSYRGHEIWEMPPNGQGLATLIGLGILDGCDVSAHPRESVESYHLQLEALKLGLTDAMRWVADPDHLSIRVDDLLNPGYLAERRALIGERALEPSPGRPQTSGTVYVCAADADGMMVSYIQSNYMGFGSGIVVPERGIALHNRGAGFVLEEGHPNRFGPGKRPYHTIMPGFVTREGRSIGPFGVMGGFMQAQGHLQIVVNTLDYAQNPQAALDAPRWRWDGGRQVAIEPQVGRTIIEGLRARGHEIEVESRSVAFGRGQIIWRLSGGYAAGSDMRADGGAVGY